ncbi:MAG: gliding motility-associated C-terminal domain-containing protein, partial [Bacteroidota bacterium]
LPQAFSLFHIEVESPVLLAQTCIGNLGENIFEEGDFGSGTANLLATDPGIAPGYTYTTFVPPEDGFYTITNNTGEWPGLFPSWLPIRDRSTDPNGYMMVVNASFEPGLFYEQEIDGLCDNTTYLFSADVINLIRANVTGHIAPNISFLLDGVEQFTTGNIPQSELWDNYGFSFTTAPGQNSVILSLRNNAPGGIGNDLAIDNISFRPCGPRAIVRTTNIPRICQDNGAFTLISEIVGNQYDMPVVQWQQSFDEGQTWQDIDGADGLELDILVPNSGFYYYRFLLANGMANIGSALCRVVSDEIVVEVVPEEFFVTDTICETIPYELGNSIYTESGMYRDTLASSLGCDSIVNLDLTVVPEAIVDLDLDIQQPICGGGTGTVDLNNIGGGNPPYLSLVIGLSGDTLELLSGGIEVPEGFYLVVVVDRFECVYGDTFRIQAPEPLTVDVGPDRSIRLGEEVTISPTISDPIVNFSWNPFPDNCLGDCLPAVFSPPTSDFYIFTAEDELGCVATDSLFIEVRPRRQIYIPNAFSPNNDGVNDAFAPIVISPNVSRILRFDVFDRWGGQVYSQTDWLPRGISDGWDGQVRGRLASVGVYAYQAEVLFLDGEVIRYTGDVLLLR